jgi:hypothetical protein
VLHRPGMVLRADTERLADQRAEQGIEQIQRGALPGRDCGVIGAPGVQGEFAVVENVEVDPDLQVRTTTIDARFESETLGCGFKECGLRGPFRRVATPQVTQDLGRIAD